MSQIKRQRTTISCSVCRKRKSKCDRSRPVCGSCKKKSIAHLCCYDDEHQPPNQYYAPLSGPSYVPMARPPLLNGHRPAGAPENGVLPLPPAANPYFQMMPVLSPSVPWAQAPQSYFEQFRSPSAPSAAPQMSPSSSGYSTSHPADASLVSPHGADQREVRDVRERDPERSGYAFHPYRPREYSVMASPVDFGDSPNGSSGRSNSHSSGLHQYSISSDNSAHSVPVKKPHGPFPGADRARSVPSVTSEPVPETPGFSAPDSSAYPALDSSAYPAPKRAPYPAPDSASYPAPASSSFSADSGFVAPKSLPSDGNSLVSTPMAGSGSGKNIGGSQNSSAAFPPGSATSSPTKQVYSQSVDDANFVSVTIGSNVLRISVDDTIDAFSCASHTLLVEGSHWQQQGPLSYVGLTKRDQFFKLVRNFTVGLFRSEQFSQYVSTNQKKSANSGGVEVAESDLDTNDEQESEEDILNEDTLVTTKIQLDEKSGLTDGYNAQYPAILPGLQSLNTIHCSKKMYYAFVEENVLSILPCKSAVTEAINNYFQYVHPFVPIIHELSFMRELAPLFRKSDPESGFYKKISIRNDSHLNLAGQLLLIIRLGYMTLIPNSETHRRYTKIEQALIKDVTKIKANHYMSIVALCIPEEKMQIKSTFKLVQSLTLLLFYRSVAPNDCFGLSGSDSQLLHGAIVNHALSIGLNRDPLKYDTINSISKDESYVHTWRSLWNHIVNMDATNSIYCGTALKLPNLEISDTEKPSFESASNESIQYSLAVDSVCSCYRRIVNKVTNLTSELRVIDLLIETSKLERIFLEIFGKDFFKDYVCGSAPEDVDCRGAESRERNEEAYLKVHRFLLFINTRANLSCLYYLVVIHYEKKLDEDPNAEAQAGIELFKIFIRSVVQLVYIMSYVLDNMQELFGKSYDYLLTSRIERSMIKTHTFVSSFFIRLINYKRTLAVKEMTGKALQSSDEENFDERCEIMDGLFTIILLEAELFVGHFRTLSKTYINSYKLYVMAFFVLKQCMENPELLLAGVTNSKEQFFNDGTNLIQFLSNSELQSLCKLCEEFRLAKLESIRRQKEHQNVSRGKRSKKKEHEKKERVKDENGNADESMTGMESAPSLASLHSNGSPDRGTDEEAASTLEDDFSSQTSGIFDVTVANRAMYANEDTVNTYGLLTEKHMHADYSNEVFDEQNMIGNDELLKLFDTYGLLDG